MVSLCHSVTLSLCHSVTLSLCHSVVNKRSNISAPFHPFGPKFFLRPFGQTSMSQKKIFLRPRAGWAAAGGQKTVIFQAISAISQDIGPKIET